MWFTGCGCSGRDKGNRNRVTGVCVMRQGMLQKVSAPVTIDATGTGLLAAKAGCEYFYGSDARKDFNESIGLEKSDGRVQPCTMMYISQRTRSDAEFPATYSKPVYSTTTRRSG
ncbi:FAD-dependent oxidoreductase [Bacteroides sp. CR5/BHMF/2]|nr:FAD-dependent oxidoreductase [Bacteroides sp. CR5/BHMF/2]